MWGDNCGKSTKQSKGHECGKEICKEKGWGLGEIGWQSN